jgi:hypothetical protein
MKNFFLSLRDTIHSVTVKFGHAYLPNAKKPYNAHVALQTELDLDQIAEKATVYNLNITPAQIVEGTNAFFVLCYYLLADGYKLKTSLFNSFMRIPGEYDGTETKLPDDVFPAIRMEAAAALRKYIQERVTVVFDGIDETKGIIGSVVDGATGKTDGKITIGNIIDISGAGMKIEGDKEHASEVGFFFVSDSSADIRVTIIPVNEPKLLKVLVPQLEAKDYTIVIRTQSSAKTSSSLLKNVREVRSDFTVTPR